MAGCGLQLARLPRPGHASLRIWAPLGGKPASEQRNGAYPRRLQLAGDGEGSAQRGISRGFRTGRPRRPMGTVTRVSGKALLEPKLVRRGAPAVLWREGRWGTRALGSAGRVGGQPGLQVARLCEIEQVFRQQLQLVQGEG